MRMALVVEYEGTNYHGFQYQTNAPSIQEDLERAIRRLTGEQVRVNGAGRTDAGVHAKGQVVAFDTETDHRPETFVRALNFYLPGEIGVKAAYRTQCDFDPRRMALSRRYMYTIDNGATQSPLIRRTSYHFNQPLDVPTMRTAARHFVGEHDFARLAGPPDKNGAGTVRQVYETKVQRDGHLIFIDVEGSSFLPHQVRRMAGALVQVGNGSLTSSEVRSIVECEPGGSVAPSLPPHGLCLVEVAYADFPPKVGKQDGNPH